MTIQLTIVTTMVITQYQHALALKMKLVCKCHGYEHTCSKTDRGYMMHYGTMLVC